MVWQAVEKIAKRPICRRGVGLGRFAHWNFFVIEFGEIWVLEGSDKGPVIY